MTRTTLGILIGLALGLTLAFGSFGQMLIVALFVAVGFVVAKVLEDPELVVTAALEETADFAALRQRIETRALIHARSAVGNPSLPTQLDLTVTTKRSTRVA